MSLTSKIKGWFGEQKTAFNLWFSLDSNTHHRFHNLILPSDNGTTQIDHLIISKFGVFIIETKNRKGWIFGSEKGATWTQTVYKRKYKFQNPLHQTYRQKKVLSQFLRMDEAQIFCIVFFTGDVTFRTPMPVNVIRGNIGGRIKRYKKEIISVQEVNRMVIAINHLKSTNKLRSIDHVRSLKQRHGSNSKCPRCGSKLIVRTNKRNGKNKKFLGCEKFPKCRFSKSFE